jgi:Transposase DDE domain
MTPKTVLSEWETVAQYLPPNWEALATEHQQIQTQFGNAKITTAAALLQLILVHVVADLPLRQTVTLVGEAGGPAVSPMRLHMKMRRAEPYLHALVAQLVEVPGRGSASWWGGYDVVLVDGSTVCGPGAVGIDARLHTVLRVNDLACVHVAVTGADEGETLTRFTWAPNQLVVADRGYANAPGIAAVVRDGGQVLVRLNRGALPLWHPDGTPFEVLPALRSLTRHRARDWRVEARWTDGEGAVHTIRGRLCAFRLPPAEAAKARAWVLREQGANASAETLEASQYVALFTTVPRTRLSAARAIELYRVRWQLELQFKRWKSLCGLDRLPNYRDDTIRAWLYAKLLAALLVDRMMASATSPPAHPDTDLAYSVAA